MKKKNILILASILVFIILLVILFFIINPFKKKNIVVDSSEIEEKINKIGEIYYKKYYYKGIDKELLASFEDNGISISITNLGVYKKVDSDIEKLYDQSLNDFLNKYKCNYDRTLVIINPSNPFGENDFKVSTKFSCNF